MRPNEVVTLDAGRNSPITTCNHRNADSAKLLLGNLALPASKFVKA
jgi:hypothetical protein